MICGVCPWDRRKRSPWHISLTPKWSAMATYELSSSSSSIIKEILKNCPTQKLSRAAKQKKNMKKKTKQTTSKKVMHGCFRNQMSVDCVVQQCLC
jgi:hypothetical protein